MSWYWCYYFQLSKTECYLLTLGLSKDIQYHKRHQIPFETSRISHETQGPRAVSLADDYFDLPKGIYISTHGQRSHLPPKSLTLTLPSPSAGVSGSLDSYCSLKPLCSGMGEVVPARTLPTLLPHKLALCCHYPVSKCRSASIVVTSTVRVN